MSDQHKPLTAAEILTISTMEAICDGHSDMTVAVIHMQEILNKLSALTPPTDAALREAVESLVQAIGWAGMHQQGDDEVAQVSVSEARTLLSYVLAVQAPRLSEGRLEALKTAYLHVRYHGPQHDANTILAVFPELQEMHECVFGKEG